MHGNVLYLILVREWLKIHQHLTKLHSTSLAFFFQISFIIKTLISNLRCLAAISISGKGPSSYGSNSNEFDEFNILQIPLKYVSLSVVCRRLLSGRIYRR